MQMEMEIVEMELVEMEIVEMVMTMQLCILESRTLSALCVAARQIHLESQPGKHLCSNAACLQLSVSQRQQAPGTHIHTHTRGEGQHTLMSGSSAQSAIS